MAQFNPIEAAIWGPEAASELAGNRQAHEDARAIIRTVQEGNSAVEHALAQVAGRVAAADQSIVAAIRQEAAETRAVMAVGFEALSFETRSQTIALERIAEALENPKRTSARELLHRGEVAFGSGIRTGDGAWFNDAANDFAECLSIDRYEYRAHWYLGQIAFAHHESAADAFEHYLAAARYAEVDNPAMCAASLAWVARLQWSRGDVVGALATARRAIARDASCASAHLEAASSAARLGDTRTALEASRKSVQLEPRLLYAIAADQALSTLPVVAAWVDETHDAVRAQAAAAAGELKLVLAQARDTARVVGRSFRADPIDAADDVLTRLVAALGAPRFDELLVHVVDAHRAKADLIRAVDEQLVALGGVRRPAPSWLPGRFIRQGERRRSLALPIVGGVFGLALWAVVAAFVAFVAFVPVWLLLIIVFAIAGVDGAYGAATGWASMLGFLAYFGVVGYTVYAYVSDVVLPARRERRLQEFRLDWEERYPPEHP